MITGVDGAELKAGYSYTVNIEVTADNVKATIGGEIEGWEDGGNLSGGDYEPSFEEFDGYFVYDGVKYNTVTLSNGRTWMAAPLAYVPFGKTVSEDPANGEIWYPYSSDGSTATVLKDAESIAKNGYLYSYNALLATTLTEDNFYDFEGCQGVCPKGWHIPTRAEWYALCGSSNAISRLGESGVQTDANALFWDSTLGYAPVANFNAAGFAFTLSGCIANNKYNTLVTDSSVCADEDLLGANRMAYIACSTANAYSSNNYMAAMTTFTSANNHGKVSLSFATLGKVGVQVRCIKDE